MATKYRKIDPRIWDDEAFDRLNAHEALAAIWLLTSNCTKRCGYSVTTTGEAADKLRTDTPAQALNTLSTACEQLGWLIEHTGRTIVVVALPRWFRYNPPTNPDHLRGAMSDLRDVPRCGVLEQAKPLIRSHLDDKYHSLYNSLWIEHTTGSTTPCEHQEQEQEQEQEQKPPLIPPEGKRLGGRKWLTEIPDDFGPPAGFEAGAGREAADRWLAYRSSNRQGYTVDTLKPLLYTLRDWGVEEAVHAIGTAINAGHTRLQKPLQTRSRHRRGGGVPDPEPNPARYEDVGSAASEMHTLVRQRSIDGKPPNGDDYDGHAKATDSG